jgi:hypothetical protein
MRDSGVNSSVPSRKLRLGAAAAHDTARRKGLIEDHPLAAAFHH